MAIRRHWAAFSRRKFSSCIGPPGKEQSAVVPRSFVLASLDHVAADRAPVVLRWSTETRTLDKDTVQEKFRLASEQTPNQSVVTSVGQRFTVLFVEDDALVRGALPYVLPEDEFDTLVAEGGLEAMRMLAEHHVDVLVTDLVMPGVTGLELATQARLLRTDLRIMFMSGYFPRAVEAEAIGPVMFKPIMPRELENAIRQYLGVSIPGTPPPVEPSA